MVPPERNGRYSARLNLLWWSNFLPQSCWHIPVSMAKLYAVHAVPLLPNPNVPSSTHVLFSVSQVAHKEGKGTSVLMAAVQSRKKNTFEAALKVLHEALGDHKVENDLLLFVFAIVQRPASRRLFFLCISCRYRQKREMDLYPRSDSLLSQVLSQIITRFVKQPTSVWDHQMCG